MAGNKNITDADRTNTFKQRPQDAGRKKKIYTILRDSGYGKDDIKTAMGELAWYTQKEIKEFADDTTKPAIIRIIAQQYIQAIEKNDMNKISEILSYQVNKPTQSYDVHDTRPLIQLRDQRAIDNMGKLEDIKKDG